MRANATLDAIFRILLPCPDSMTPTERYVRNVAILACLREWVWNIEPRRYDKEVQDRINEMKTALNACQHRIRFCSQDGSFLVNEFKQIKTLGRLLCATLQPDKLISYDLYIGT